MSSDRSEPAEDACPTATGTVADFLSSLKVCVENKGGDGKASPPVPTSDGYVSLPGAGGSGDWPKAVCGVSAEPHVASEFQEAPVPGVPCICSRAGAFASSWLGSAAVVLFEPKHHLGHPEYCLFLRKNIYKKI